VLSERVEIACRWRSGRGRSFPRATDRPLGRPATQASRPARGAAAPYRRQPAAFLVRRLLYSHDSRVQRPEAWAYWKDLYFSPSMTSSRIGSADLDGSTRSRPALFISGTIGDAAASWLRNRLDEAHLVAGDAVLMSSPGGDLNQAMIMGEIIRSRGLLTAVGTADAADRIRPPAPVCWSMPAASPALASKARCWGSIGL